ncbi:MAG: hypothetical protein LBV43_12255 [Prevotella sp.]|nr:hypothetical protein [Prevotella sp.]
MLTRGSISFGYKGDPLAPLRSADFQFYRQKQRSTECNVVNNREEIKRRKS